MEKFSEIAMRKEKVAKLKEKIKKEISTYRDRYRLILNPDTDNTYEGFEEDYKKVVLEMAVLYAIEDFINKEDSFMSYEMYDKNADTIIYKVSLRDINIMLQDEFSVVSNMIFELDEHPESYYYIGTFMNDDYFGYNFISAIEIALYEEKQKKNKETT